MVVYISWHKDNDNVNGNGHVNGNDNGNGIGNGNGNGNGKFQISNWAKQGVVLSLLIFSIYLDDLSCELWQVNVECHWNGYFVGAVIYADDIILLGSTRSFILSMLNGCDVYVRNMDILFYSAKTNCIFSPVHLNSLPGIPLHFMNTDIVCVPSCTFSDISVSNHDISDRNIPQSVHNLFRRSNKVICLISNLFPIM